MNAWRLIRESGGVLSWESIYQPYVDNLPEHQRAA
jgi:hypothetical protein